MSTVPDTRATIKAWPETVQKLRIAAAHQGIRMTELLDRLASAEKDRVMQAALTGAPTTPAPDDVEDEADEAEKRRTA